MSRGRQYRVIASRAAVVALVVLVVFWLSQPSLAKAPTTSTPAETPAGEVTVSTTAAPEPTSTATPAIAVVTPSPTAAAPAAPTIRPTARPPRPPAMGRSQVDSDPAYYADVMSFQFIGSAFRLQIDAAGRPGMAVPPDSCLSDPAGGRIRASSFISSVIRPGQYAGDIEFPASEIVPGVGYSFSYSCAYSEVPLGVLLPG